MQRILITFQGVFPETAASIDSNRSKANQWIRQLNYHQSRTRYQDWAKYSGIFHCRICRRCQTVDYDGSHYFAAVIYLSIFTVHAFVLNWLLISAIDLSKWILLAFPSLCVAYVPQGLFSVPCYLQSSLYQSAASPITLDSCYNDETKLFHCFVANRSV